MTFRALFQRPSALLLAAAALVACSSATDRVAGPLLAPSGPHFDESPTPQAVVISQIYGGGGSTNPDATLTNDFIELFNPTATAVDLTGWSVQYAAATGASWQVTPLSGSIAPGAYYLVQEAAGGGGATALPTPDATGVIALAPASGKVLLSASTTAITGACPVGAVDLVPYGTVASCGTTAPLLTNTTAALRANNGCTYTASPGADFVSGAPNPRNSATAVNLCGAAAPPPPPAIVISQLYGGGGNSGATLKNDFIELFNPGTTSVDVSTWSVQYASAAGTTWQVTKLTGSIPAGGYYLVSESQGTGGTVNLPTPDVPGTIAMSAASAKVLLTSSQTAASGACPTGGIDLVAYGAVTGCGTDAPLLTNTTAAIRVNGGCYYTNSPGADFVSGAPAPRNSTSANHLCGGVSAPPGDPVTVTVTPNPATVSLNATTSLIATARDANHNAVTTTFTWTSSDPNTASVDASGVVMGKAVGGPVTITATSANQISGSTVVTVQTPPSNVTVSSRSTPLPIGFQAQVFASGTDNSGHAVSTVTWSTSDQTIITVDANGVVTAVGAGSAKVIATTPDNASGQTTITVETDLSSNTTRIGHNTEFGIPTDADPSNDIMLVRKQYTISWNPAHAGPNWVSWNMDATHLGTLDRCNCFSADTGLTRQGFPAYTTNDYITGDVYDRGHMEPSADQTTTDYENANTFFLSNVLPQKHDLNAGPWEDLENALRDSATKSGREVYTIAGGIFTNGVGLGTLNNLGKIGIPDSTWKIALILPAGKGLADVHSPADLSVIAVNMPNVAGIASNKFPMYATTIAQIEKSTGYNFLNLLPEAIQCKIEVRDCLAVSTLTSASGSSTATSGSPFTLDISAADADGADGPWKLVVQWGDGSAPFNSTLLSLPTDLHPLARSHTWTGTPGQQFTVTVSITDKKGGVSTSTFTVTIAP